jgi:hypothetical protein
MNTSMRVSSGMPLLLRPPTPLKELLNSINKVWMFQGDRVGATSSVQGRFAIGKLPFFDAYRMTYQEAFTPRNPDPYYLEGVIRHEPETGEFVLKGDDYGPTLFELRTQGWEGSALNWSGWITPPGAEPQELRESWTLLPGGTRMNVLREVLDPVSGEWNDVINVTGTRM